MFDFITPTSTVVITIIFFATMIILFPIFEKITKKHVGKELPDTTLRYNTTDLYRWAEEYGENGRKNYIILRFTYDLFFPLVYGSFLFLWLGTIIMRLNPWFSFLAYIPLFGMSLDYIENIMASIIMARYPKHTKGIDRLLPPISYIKRLSVILSFLLLVFLSIINLVF